MPRPRTAVLAAAATGIALAACAVPRAAPAPRLVGVEACSASVALRLAPDPDAPAPSSWAPPARDSAAAFVSAARVRLTPDALVRLPGTVRAAWQDSLYLHPGETAPRRWARTLRISGVRLGHESLAEPVRRVDVDREVPLRCGERTEHAVDVPRTRTLRVSSDPAGASVFARVPTGAHGDEERFVGVTPADIALVWRPGQRFATLRLEKSGHTAATPRVERGDAEVRVVLHPVPDTRP